MRATSVNCYTHHELLDRLAAPYFQIDEACSTIDGDIQVTFPLFGMHVRQMFDINMRVPRPVVVEGLMLGLTNISGSLRYKFCQC